MSNTLTRPVDESVVAHAHPRLRAVRIGMAVTDLLVLIAAFVTAQAVRSPSETPTSHGDVGWLVGALTVLLWAVLLTTMRTRDPRIIGLGGDEYRRLLTACLTTGGALAVTAFLLDLDIARGYVAVAFPVALVLLVLGRRAWRTVLVHRRAAGHHLVDVLLVGDLDDVEYVGSRILATPAAGYRVRGVLTDTLPSGRSAAIGPTETSVLGGVDDVLQVAGQTAVGAVVFTGAIAGGHERLRRLGWELERAGVELVVSSPLVDVAAARVHHRAVDGLPLMHVETPDYTRRMSKRLFDVVGAACGLLVLAPVAAVIAVAIRLDDGGPVLFRQHRVGRGGVEFPIVKFRTMCVDAEARKAELLSADEGAGPLFKVHADPRVTRVGAFLRRTSLDELPQLWNVLTGSMSLVGPRPALPCEVAVYADFAERRLLVTPGITGLWQVSGRSDLDWAEGVRLDLHYVENWSFLHDLVILARTVPSVLRSRGAY
ncbi:sugar transferase [Curtobacterium sp. MCPF17_011]|uniref:sugar transferase n=1 Tax=unclassified Curtobacterium TaxID=257496 RepID=UPI000D931B6C|nr:MULTISPECIES: sugar transferase [unclassified Curtobacterium]PYY33946.1 sugar transferase [Curtobacterium sp. MCBD17_030]PZF10266.1 sugar transferase [Curtobacterium sp. MCPF17_011]